MGFAKAFLDETGVDPQRLGIGKVETVEGNPNNMVETVLSLDVQGDRKIVFSRAVDALRSTLQLPSFTFSITPSPRMGPALW